MQKVDKKVDEIIQRLTTTQPWKDDGWDKTEEEGIVKAEKTFLSNERYSIGCEIDIFSDGILFRHALALSKSCSPEWIEVWYTMLRKLINADPKFVQKLVGWGATNAGAIFSFSYHWVLLPEIRSTASTPTLCNLCAGVCEQIDLITWVIAEQSIKHLNRFDWKEDEMQAVLIDSCKLACGSSHGKV